MSLKKKPSAKPRQTKSAEAPELVAASPAKKAKTSTKSAKQKKASSPRWLVFIWFMVVVAMGAVLAWPYAKQLRWPDINIKLHMPHLPDLSKLFPDKPVEKIKEPEPAEKEEAVLPSPAEKISPVPSEAEQLKQQLLEAEQRIQQLESTVQQKDKALQYEVALRGQSLLAQYARLIEHALEKGLPFPWELEQLQHFSDNNMPEAVNLVQALAPYAQGVASVEKLQEDFKTMSDEVYIRWKKEDTTTGIRAMFWRMMHQVISIRRVGLVEGHSPEAIIARAEYYLNKGDVAQAVQELSVFQGSYANIVQPWVAEAKLRLEALKLMQGLHALAQKVTSGPALDAPKNVPDLPNVPAKVELH